MSQARSTVMTIPQAVELLRDAGTIDVSPEQVAALRELIERTPNCLPLLGGRRRVEQFLEHAERKAKDPAPTAHPTPPTEASLHPDSRRQRPLLELGLMLGGLLMVIGGVCLALFGTSWISSLRKPASSPVADKPAAATALVTNKAQAKPKKKKSAVTPDTAAADDQNDELLWNGWHVEGSPGSVTLRKTIWNVNNPQQPEADVVMVLGAKPAKLLADRLIDAEHRWLRMELANADGPSTGELEIVADGKTISRVKLEPVHVGTPLLVPLEALLGRTARLEVRYLPESAQSVVAVRSLALAAQSTHAPWIPLKPASATAQSGATLSILPDGSVLAGGPNAGVEAYDVTVTLPAAATAVRLDALPDASLPGQGPGRAANGEFLLTRFSAVQTASVRKLDVVPARYVRIELYGPQRALTLAEVEVFSGGENVARGKKATQSSTIYGAVAGRAVDGFTRNDFKRGKSVTHTNNEPGAWWAVDLGREYPVDKIVVYGRGGYAQEQANHRIVVIDDKNEKRWQFENPMPPDPSISYGPFLLEAQPVALTAVAVEKGPNPLAQDPNAAGTIRDGIAGPSGWAGLGAATMASAVFTLAQPMPAGDQQVTFHLVCSSSQPGKNLGRFRLHATSAPPPHKAESALIVLPVEQIKR